CTSISPSVPAAAPSGAGLRTATAHVETPRIITPSRTAWPPTGASRCASSGASAASSGASAAAGSSTAISLAALGALGGAAAEALDTAARVHQLLTAGVERVAVRADLDVDLGLRRARPELVAARAGDVREHVLGMDIRLHRAKQCSGTRPPAYPASAAA